MPMLSPKFMCGISRKLCFSSSSFGSYCGKTRESIFSSLRIQEVKIRKIVVILDVALKFMSMNLDISENAIPLDIA